MFMGSRSKRWTVGLDRYVDPYSWQMVGEVYTCSKLTRLLIRTRFLIDLMDVIAIVITHIRVGMVRIVLNKGCQTLNLTIGRGIIVFM